MCSTVYIAIGSNLGDRFGNCQRAVSAIGKMPKTSLLKISKWYNSKALSCDDETHPDYLNGAVKIETELEPLQLLAALKEIEKEMDRKPSNKKWEDRMIDLDILLYDSLVLNTEQITIPHPEMTKRVFVMKPLCDIAG